MARFARIAFLVLVVLATVPARAQEPTPQEAEAFQLYKDAKADIDAQRFQEALRKLDRALALHPMPQITMRQAECFEKMGEMERALEIYRQVQTDDPKLKGKVEKAIADLVYELNKPVDLSIVPNVNDVEVTVDNGDRFRCPCTVQVTRGKHTFEMRKTGYGAFTEERNVRGATTQTWKVSLKEQVGRIVLRTDLDDFRGVVVRLDDKDLAPAGRAGAPAETDPFTVRAGTHSILCVREGLAPYMGRFEVAPEVTVEVNCKLRPVAKASNIVAPALEWTAVGVGAALIGVGTWALVSYLQEKDQYDNNPNSDYKISSSNKNILGPVGIAAGAAIAITGSAFLIRDAVRASKPRTQVSPLSSLRVGVSPVPGGAVGSASFSF